jgi:hypothetical protein
MLVWLRNVGIGAVFTAFAALATAAPASDERVVP